LTLAQLLESRGRFEEARAEFTSAITEDPWLTSAHYGFGTASLSVQKIEDPELAFQEAI